MEDPLVGVGPVVDVEDTRRLLVPAGGVGVFDQLAVNLLPPEAIAWDIVIGDSMRWRREQHDWRGDRRRRDADPRYCLPNFHGPSFSVGDIINTRGAYGRYLFLPSRFKTEALTARTTADTA